MRELEWSYPKLADFQREWLDDPHRFKIIEGATGTGKTFVYEPSLFQKAHGPEQRGDEYWWIAPTIDQARAVFEGIERMIVDADAIDIYKIDRSLREITTPEGGILCFKTGEKPDHLFGIRNVREIVVDEFTRCRMSLWPALLSIANKTGCSITFIGNYQGDDTEWHLWVEEVKNDPDFRYWKTTALQAVEAGIMPQSMFDTAKRTLPQAVFDALYLCQGSSDPSLLVDYAAVADLWYNDHIQEGAPGLVCDIALHGSDRFVLSTFMGRVLTDIEIHEKRKPEEVTAIIQGKATANNVPRSSIVYDADGMGAYLTGYLQGAVPYHGGNAMQPTQGLKMAYQNMRAQTHFLTADAINARLYYFKTKLHKPELEQEIFACLRTSGQDAAGRWGIIPKDKPMIGAKARLGRSPDIFDTIHMNEYRFMTPPPILVDGLAKTAERRRVAWQSRPKPSVGSTTKFDGR